MKSKILVSSIILSSFFCSLAHAKDNQWIIRSRAVYVKTDTSSSVESIGGQVKASSDQIPELDFTRFITPNIAAELILATSKHDIALQNSSSGNVNLGSVKLLPPTLTLQYHANPTGTFRPYAGAGLNYTIFYGAKSGDVDSVKYQNHFGYALQAGFDYMIDERVSVNFDVKKIYLETTAKVNNSIRAEVDLDPWLVGIGLGYHF